MLTKDKNVKRDNNALTVSLYSYLYDKLDNALWDDNFILPENSLPADLDLKDQIEVYGRLKIILVDCKTCYQLYGKRNLWD